MSGPVDAPTGIPRVLAPIELWPSNVFPVKDGTELCRIVPIFGGTMYMNPKFTFEVAFGETGLFQGEPLVPSLHQLVYIIKGIRNIFAPLLL
jgi:hypothetical protein